MYDYLVSNLDWLAASFCGIVLFVCLWKLDKKSYIMGVLLGVSGVGVVLAILLNIFSNKISKQKEHFAIYIGSNSELVVQKDPGFYYGLYEAYYFDKYMSNTACRGGARNPFGIMIKENSGCVKYVLLPEKIKGQADEKFLIGFDSSNDQGKENTVKLVVHYTNLVATGALPDYPDFIKVIPAN